MTILLHNDLNTTPVKRQFDKVLTCLEKGDFRSAEADENSEEQLDEGVNA